jgi:hypothetical protein
MIFQSGKRVIAMEGTHEGNRFRERLREKVVSLFYSAPPPALHDGKDRYSIESVGVPDITANSPLLLIAASIESIYRIVQRVDTRLWRPRRPYSEHANRNFWTHIVAYQNAVDTDNMVKGETR